jgi:hypothetical protein
MQLFCLTCKEPFLPFLATDPGELLYPHGYDDHESCRGRECDCRGQDRAVESIRSFHQVHAGHSLTERVYQHGEQPCAQQGENVCS